ncbi:MAG TPA: glycosyltransferase [Caulobacteraceae bacterium]|nr:glycosyltransferase [Caulobacteraceae bacterium]
MTYRALLKALSRRGHSLLFLERDTPWYAEHRDLPAPDYCRLEFYRTPRDLGRWSAEVSFADAVIVGSYVPDGIAVGEWAMRTAHGPVAFYDIDTPVTLSNLARGEATYLAEEQIADYDIYFSFTGGPTLQRLERAYGSPAARALYCSADAEVYRPVDTAVRWDLSYLGTYSADRQPGLERLLLEPARRAPHLKFVVAGPQYPNDFRWPANVQRLDHVSPADHPAFYGASRFTLNVTRADMIAAGFSPSIRLFEAAACGAPIISDIWAGLETLFTPGEEILLARDPEDVLVALALDARRRDAIACEARRRVLRAHTADNRAATLETELRRAGRERPRRNRPKPRTDLAANRYATSSPMECPE